MKTRFLLPICLVAALAFPAWGATLLYEGFDGMEKGKLPKGWEASKTIDYYTNTTYSPVPPSIKFDKEFSVSSRPFSTGATNVSFMHYTANDSGHCNAFQVNGWIDGNWVEIGTVSNMDVKQFQTLSVPVANPQITRVQLIFTNKSYNAAVDDIRVEGPFGLTCDHEDEFTLPQGTGDAITVEADYDFATPDTEFEFAWSGALEGTGAVLDIPDDLEPGTYELTCTCTAMVNGEEEARTSGTISFRVLEFHAISVEACEHGVVTVGVDTAVEGTTVLLEATPDEDYVLSWIAVNGEKLPPETLEFPMPDTNAVITAFFKLYEEGDLIVTFDDNSSKNPAYASDSFFARCISGGIVVSNQFNALLCYGGDKRGSSGTDLTMRVKHDDDTAKGYFATADELEHPIARISFDYKAYSSSSTHVDKPWALETSTDGAHWTNLVTVKTTADWETCEVKEGIPENSFWFRIISANKGSTDRTANFDNINIWWGTATYRVKLTGVKPDEKVVCDSDNPLVLTAEGLDGEEPYEYAWTVNGVEAGSDETCTFSETGDYEVEVSCTDARGSNAVASVRFSLATQYKVTYPGPVDGCYIVVSTNKAFAGDKITVQDKPKYGYTLATPLTATCDGEPVEIIDGEFTMPEGDVEIAGTFRQVSDVATLPFEYHGPWQTTTNFSVDGMLSAKLGSDVKDNTKDKEYDGQGNGAAKFSDQSSIIQIHFDSAPDTLSYMIRGENLSECTCTVFLVQESENGDDWSTAVKYESTEQVPPNDNTLAETITLKSTSRYVKFGYKDMSKGTGAIGLDAILITKGEGEEPVTVTATLADGGITFEDGNAKMTVTLEPVAEIQEGDIWATTNLLDATSWQPADGATVEKADDGKYVITVPPLEGPINFLSVGKPIVLQE